MPIFHKIICKHIFQKRETLYVTKGKMYMHAKKGVLCCKFSIFNNYNFVSFGVFLLYISIEGTCICKISIIFFKIRVKSSFSHSAFGRSECRLSNSTVIFLPYVSDVWRWPNPEKIPNVPFLLQNRSVTRNE